MGGGARRPGMNARASQAAPGKPGFNQELQDLKPHSWGAAFVARRFIAGRVVGRL